MYVCVRKKTGDIHLALAAGTLYLFSYPVIDGIFKSFTLAQTQALVFLPLALMGMVLFVEKDEFPWMLGIGFTGLIYSHALSTAIALVLCFVLLVFQLPKWIGKKKKVVIFADGSSRGIRYYSFLLGTDAGADESTEL